jgi:exosome complex component CSL4
MSEPMTFPGDQIASIEEYESGDNTFDDGDKVRSLVVGRAVMDKKDRVASVSKLKEIGVPKAGDIVVGSVAAVLPSMIALTIQYINGRPIKTKVECVCSTKNIRKRNIALANDLMSMKIVSHINGTLHATISEPNLGVLYTKCRKCGGVVIQIREDSIKCKECAWMDERKLSTNFGNLDFVTVKD